jgi:hypothetical protein
LLKCIRAMADGAAGISRTRLVMGCTPKSVWV